jgi:hypothetical protein
VGEPENLGEEEPIHDALVSRLRVIEDQPLDSRAAAYTQLHEELRETLEGSDSSAARQHG